MRDHKGLTRYWFVENWSEDPDGDDYQIMNRAHTGDDNHAVALFLSDEDFEEQVTRLIGILDSVAPDGHILRGLRIEIDELSQGNR